MRSLALAVGVGVCALQLAVTGCGTTQTDATSASPTKLSDAQLWDPCTVSDDAISAIGLRPGSKDTNPAVVQWSGWRGCGWRTDNYFLTILNSNHTMTEVRKNSYLTNFQDVSIPGRQAITDAEKSSTSDNCIVTLPTSKGTVEIIIRQAVGAPSAGNYCSIAISATKSLNSLIPQ
ncbi:DUF3558 domain-containing protein [Nocardia macrotermitis]|uniref:DUF3558 domain-containing protein n=1 Tax=Nocardia macrotermitis TaxID=2585198 RepID=UPI0012977EDC|nr:DUF3558 domain-containing protein [Nocardia macrotermitis]